MNIGSAAESPKFKNLCFKHKQSPKELKDKMRKNYKDKVKTCRDMLLDRFRGPVIEEDICSTLTEIYKNMIKQSLDIEIDEVEVLEELRNELVQEELEWWLREYDKSQMENIDWSTVEEDDSVICPVCQKCNFKLVQNMVSCENCKCNIKTQQSLADIKKCIMYCIEKHNNTCSCEPQFSVIPESNEAHIFLICNACSDMSIVV